MADNLEAKICVLGAAGVGKTSLVQRYVSGTFTPPTVTSTVGASFVTKRAVDTDSGSTVRLQIWDTAGQERFRSISKLYYRGASAIILVYSIIDDKSFVDMGRWLQEVREHLGSDAIVHVVGTKQDIVTQDPSKRKVPFERCIAYVAEHLYPTLASTPPPTAAGPGVGWGGRNSGTAPPATTPAAGLDGQGKRNSGFWTQDVGWDVCHEVSSSSGEGIEEVFRVITRKLVEQAAKNSLNTPMSTDFNSFMTPRTDGARTPAGGHGYFDRPVPENGGSFRIGAGDKRRSWLGFPTPNFGDGDAAGSSYPGEGAVGIAPMPKRGRKSKCC